MNKLIERIFSRKSEHQKTYEAIKNDKPYVWDIKQYNSWGNTLGIQNGNLEGFMVNPRVKDGDFVIFETTKGTIALCKVFNVNYHRDPYDMIESAPLFQIGSISKDGETVSSLFDWLILTEGEKNVLKEYFKTGEQIYRYQGFLI